MNIKYSFCISLDITPAGEAGLGWTGLGWAGLGWAGLGCREEMMLLPRLNAKDWSREIGFTIY